MLIKQALKNSHQCQPSKLAENCSHIATLMGSTKACMQQQHGQRAGYCIKTATPLSAKSASLQLRIRNDIVQYAYQQIWVDAYRRMVALAVLASCNAHHLQRFECSVGDAAMEVQALSYSPICIRQNIGLTIHVIALQGAISCVSQISSRLFIKSCDKCFGPRRCNIAGKHSHRSEEAVRLQTRGLHQMLE